MLDFEARARRYESAMRKALAALNRGTPSHQVAHYLVKALSEFDTLLIVSGSESTIGKENDNDT